jgi:hypothetical protein
MGSNSGVTTGRINAILALAALIAVAAVFVYPLIQLPSGILKERVQIQPLVIAFVLLVTALVFAMQLAFFRSVPVVSLPAKIQGRSLEDLTCARLC